jgi:ABC-type uncharacterized transport system substrate-binding protein
VGACFALLLFLAPLAKASASDAPIAVLYPAAEGIYRDLFGQLLRGIDTAAGPQNTRKYLLEKQGPAHLSQWLGETRPQAVITLGPQAYAAYRASGYSAKSVSGALDLSPQLDRNTEGISLSAAPELFFDTLRQLLPRVDRVFVVADPAKSRWIVEHAEAAAPRYGIALVVYAASDLSAAAKHFRAIFKRTRPDRDGLWIPLDSTLIDEQAVWPLSVEESWYRRIAVFSNDLLHARLGALFALYMDPEKLGRRLAERALALARGTVTDYPHIAPLEDVKRALNIRFAHHLGVEVRRIIHEFDALFPIPGSP